MSYAAAIDALNALAPELFIHPDRPRRKFSLAEIGILLSELGNPHRRFPSVLIAGTNGKGSTAATLASILTTAGLRTGLYTSPHLERPNERIRVDGARHLRCRLRLHLLRRRGRGRTARGCRRPRATPQLLRILTAMAFGILPRPPSISPFLKSAWAVASTPPTSSTRSFPSLPIFLSTTPSGSGPPSPPLLAKRLESCALAAFSSPSLNTLKPTSPSAKSRPSSRSALSALPLTCPRCETKRPVHTPLEVLGTDIEVTRRCRDNTNTAMWDYLLQRQ